jgi:hypothetical protein
VSLHERSILARQRCAVWSSNEREPVEVEIVPIERQASDQGAGGTAARARELDLDAEGDGDLGLAGLEDETKVLSM